MEEEGNNGVGVGGGGGKGQQDEAAVNEGTEAQEEAEEEQGREEAMIYQLEAAQQQTLNRTFLLLQKKGSKKRNEVDERDVPMLIRSLGLNPMEKQIEDLILKTRSRQSSKTTQGFLDYPILERTLAETLTLEKEAFARHTEEQIMAALRVLTPDKQECFEPHFLRKLMTEKGACFSDEEADKMIRTFNDKDTGMIWHDDIAEVLAKDSLST